MLASMSQMSGNSGALVGSSSTSAKVAWAPVPGIFIPGRTFFISLLKLQVSSLDPIWMV